MPVQAIKTFVLVTIVTLLIWVYAESESLRTEDVAAAVGFSPPHPDGRAAWLVGSPDRTSVEIKLRLEGATAAIAALRSQLHSAILLTPGVELPQEAAEHSIDLRTALRANSLFARSGVTIAEVTPATLIVRVDEMTTRQLPVRVELPPGTETVGPPDIQPGLVTITLPSALGPIGGEPVLATLDRSSLAPLTPGRLERIPGVPLQPPAAIRGQPLVTMDPKVATVTITLRDKTASLDLPTVPVQIKISPVVFAEWEVDIPQDGRFLRNVRVTGPSDLIAQVRDGKLPVIAYVSLTPEDLTKGAATGNITKEVTFSDLPAPSNPLKFETEDRMVKVSIQRRTAGDASRPPPTGGTPTSR